MAATAASNVHVKNDPSEHEHTPAPDASQSDLKRWVLSAFGDKAKAKKAPSGDAAAAGKAVAPDAPPTPSKKRRRGAKAKESQEGGADASSPASRRAKKDNKGSPRSAVHETPEKQVAPGKGMWWRCNRCSFSIPASLKGSARCSRKARHIKTHGVTTTANLNNYLSRSRMLRAVWNGKMERTPGGLTKADLMLNDRGRVVPVKRSSHSSKLFVGGGLAKKWGKWCRAHKAVRRENGIMKFLKVTKDGSSTQRELYQKVLDKYNSPDFDAAPSTTRVKLERFEDTTKQTKLAFGGQ